MAKSKKNKTPEVTPQYGPWISMRTGLIVIAITSIFMAVLTTVQVWDTKPHLEAVFWGIVFGALIWAVFFGMLFFNRLLGRGQK